MIARTPSSVYAACVKNSLRFFTFVFYFIQVTTARYVPRLGSVFSG